MKSLSAAAIVFCGTLLLIASSVSGMRNAESLFNLGILVGIAGLIGWAMTLRDEK